MNYLRTHHNLQHVLSPHLPPSPVANCIIESATKLRVGPRTGWREKAWQKEEWKCRCLCLITNCIAKQFFEPETRFWWQQINSASVTGSTEHSHRGGATIEGARESLRNNNQNADCLRVLYSSSSSSIHCSLLAHGWMAYVKYLHECQENGATFTIP